MLLPRNRTPLIKISILSIIILSTHTQVITFKTRLQFLDGMAQLHTVCLHSTSARSPWEPTCRPGSSRHDCSHAQHIWLKSPANIGDCTKVTLKKKKGKKKQQKHNTSVLSTDCVWWALRGSAPATKACCQFSGVPVSTFALTVTCKDSG